MALERTAQWQCHAAAQKYLHSLTLPKINSNIVVLILDHPIWKVKLRGNRPLRISPGKSRELALRRVRHHRVPGVLPRYAFRHAGPVLHSVRRRHASSWRRQRHAAVLVADATFLCVPVFRQRRHFPCPAGTPGHRVVQAVFHFQPPDLAARVCDRFRSSKLMQTYPELGFLAVGFLLQWGWFRFAITCKASAFPSTGSSGGTRRCSSQAVVRKLMAALRSRS
jgi:hypothetical protein